MKEILQNAVYFGAMISLASYGLGVLLKRKLKWAIINPLLVAIVITIFVLVVGRIDYATYNEGGKYISYLLTPATVCLAVPLYEQLSLLKKNWQAILAGILSGTVASMLSIGLMALLFGLSHEEYVTMLPKSITTAIGMGVAEELGGYVAITAAVIIVTGIIGNMIAEIVFKCFKIEEHIAKGIALGTSAHAIGTAKALELGEIEGAMSSLSIVVAGLFTVLGASIFAQLL